MKKKGKIIVTITIGIACFILTMIIFMQFKVARETDITSIDTMRQADLQTELANWKSKYEEVKKKYEEISQTLKKYEDESNSDEKTKKNLEAELKKLQSTLGLTDVEGKGIVIKLREKDEDSEEIDADELMIIVNYLRDAGADAISINDERIINQTDFAYIRKGFIKINSKRVVEPYEIKAIGDQNYLKSSLIGKGGYKEEREALGQEFIIEDKSKIKIPKYNGELNTRYIENK